MTNMMTRTTNRLCLGLIAALLLATSGCAAMNYDQLQLGQVVDRPNRLLPEGGTTRTDRMLCYVTQDMLGRTDAIVVLLTEDRRIAARFHAVHVERNYGFKTERGYALRGEIDPELSRLGETGPVDAARAVADELTSGASGRTSVAERRRTIPEAAQWVAAGLVRLIQHWPHIGDEGPAFVRLRERLMRVPPGGSAHVAITPDGMFEFSYRHGARP